jgi:peptide/nickel transport system permease protein
MRERWATLSTRQIRTASRRLGALHALPTAMLCGAAMLVVFVCIAVTGLWWAPYGASEIATGPPFQGASWHHLFGTDELGRDVFSRTVIGTRIELVLAFAATVLGCSIGAVVGLVAAYFGGWFDGALMRVVDGIISIPFLICALLLISAAGPARTGDAALLIVVVTILYAPRMARMARAAGLEVMTRDFITIARTRGEGALSIIFREVLPITTGTLLVEFAIRLANAPLVIGSLGFLGFGIRPPTPEWGVIISENRSILLTAPITVLGPAAALSLLVIGINLFTEGLARVLGQSVRPGRG